MSDFEDSEEGLEESEETVDVLVVALGIVFGREEDDDSIGALKMPTTALTLRSRGTFVTSIATLGNSTATFGASITTLTGRSILDVVSVGVEEGLIVSPVVFGVSFVVF